VHEEDSELETQTRLYKTIKDLKRRLLSSFTGSFCSKILNFKLISTGPNKFLTLELINYTIITICSSSDNVRFACKTIEPSFHPSNKCMRSQIDQDDMIFPDT